MILLDSKEVFFEKIKMYYSEISNTISDEVLTEISNYLAIDFHEEYKRFRIRYPKSIKRYSTLKLADLANPYTHDKIIHFFKTDKPNDYEKICAELFKMTIPKFKEYEKQRNDFYAMF